MGAEPKTNRERRRLPVPATVAATFLAILVLSAVIAPALTPYGPLSQNTDERLAPPGPEHPFGTDGFGRDVFARALFGSRSTLLIAFASVAMAAAAGVSTGVLSGYAGGRWDLIYQRFIDVLLGFPSLVLALVFVVALEPSTGSLTLAVAVTLFPQIERVARASALAVGNELYVLAARSVGASSLGIAVRHVLPNSLSAVVAQASGYIGTAVIAEAALSFLGLGVPPPYPSWGRMLQEGSRQYLETAPWVTVFPGLLISMTVISCAILADALRDRIDPRGVSRTT